MSDQFKPLPYPARDALRREAQAELELYLFTWVDKHKITLAEEARILSNISNDLVHRATEHLIQSNDAHGD